MRLIDADAIMPMMQREMDMQELYLPVHFQQFIVDEMPTVDTAPAVLCHQCKHYKEREVLGRMLGFCERGTAFDPRMYYYVPKDGFCNFGEVKGENNG